MERDLVLKNSEYLATEERQDIDKQIDKIIEQHKGNSFEINRLVFDSVTALTASEARSNELAEQGMIKRFWGGVTGKNQKLQSEIDNGLARAQYASQQTLQKLAEQNLMSFELITAVNNKLNSSIIEIEDEINKIYTILLTFFKQTRSDLIQLENRVERLEKNVNLLNWLNTIEYQMFDGVEYCELNKIDKIVCITRDFYEITKGIWTASDLLLIKSALNEIGLSQKEYITYIEFIKHISGNDELFYKLIKEDAEEIASIDINGCTIINGLGKVKLLESEERYIVNTVRSQLEIYGVDENDKKLIYSILKNYIEETVFIDISSKVNLFDFIVELLLNIKMSEYILAQKYINLDFESMDFENLKKYAKKGNSNAQKSLGNRYCFGEGVELDYKKAIKWYELSAEQGNANAQYSLGDMYYFEKGVNKDYNKAIYWYIKSANQGNEAAEYSLGYMYQYGQGLEKDYKEAVKCYKLSAERGYAKSQYYLGKCYEDGIGVGIDEKLALYW